MVTLTNEQFELLLNAKTQPKKQVKSLINDFNDALNVEDFVETMEFLPINLMLSIDLPEYYSRTIIKNIEKLKVNQLPIICANYKQEKFYYRTGNEWEKGTEFIHKLHSVIYKNAVKEALEIKANKNNTDYQDINEILYNFCDVDKYPLTKLKDKIISKIAKKLVLNNYEISED